jgi:hypothetical protein
MSVIVYNEWSDLRADVFHLVGYFQAIATLLARRKGRSERGWALTPILERIEQEASDLHEDAKLRLMRRPGSEKHQIVVEDLFLIVVLAREIERTSGASLRVTPLRNKLVDLGEKLATRIEEILQSTLYD